MSPSNGPGGPAVYGRTRTKRLRIVLWLAVVFGGLVIVLEAGALGNPEVDQQLTRIALAIYLVVVILSGTTLYLMDRRDAITRLSATVSGTFLAIVGVLTVATVFGWIALILGVTLLALAVLPDDPGPEW